MPAPLIEAAEPLQALTRELADHEAIAFDLEGDGLYRYRSQLCAVQLATRDGDIRLIDTLAITDRSPLNAVLGPKGPRKTVHDVSFDARLLAENGVELGNVFDTSVSARFLDEPKGGLAALLEKVPVPDTPLTLRFSRPDDGKPLTSLATRTQLDPTLFGVLTAATRKYAMCHLVSGGSPGISKRRHGLDTDQAQYQRTD